MVALAASLTPWLAATPGPPPAQAPASALAHLAEQLARGLLRLGNGQPVELLLDDRTGTDGALGVDLRALATIRLAAAGMSLAHAGPRLRAEAVLARAERTLVLSTRVTREPGALLADVLSSSAEADVALLMRGQRTQPARIPGFEVRASVMSTVLDERVLDLAWLSEQRLLLLTAEALAVYEWDGSSARPVLRQALPAPLASVRFAAGLLALDAPAGSAWVLTNGMAEALQVRLRDGLIEEQRRAPALPWPGAPRGVTFRPSSALIDAQPPGLGAGPFVALEPTLATLAVGADGALLSSGAQAAHDTGVRVGPALARLDTAWIVAASAQPPEPEHDALLLIQRQGETWSERARLESAGPVRALATFEHPDGSVRLVAALGTRASDARLQFFELQRSDLGAELP